MDLQDAFDSGFATVKRYVDKLEAGFDARLIALEKSIAAIPTPENGKDGAPGLDGKNGLDGQNGKDGSNGLDGKDGINGKDGQDGLNGKDGLDGLNGRDGVDGRDGNNGADGLNGKDGKDGLDGKDGANGKDGVDGINGKDGAPGLNGKDGAQGRDGRDGASGLHGRDGKDGEKGLDGKDGLNGSDGLGFDDLTLVEVEDGFVLRFVRGEVKKDFRLPIPVYRGGFGQGHTYKRGDTVTWGGNLFHCNAETSSKPDSGDGTWTLAVRKGRDGKDVK